MNRECRLQGACGKSACQPSWVFQHTHRLFELAKEGQKTAAPHLELCGTALCYLISLPQANSRHSEGQGVRSLEVVSFASSTPGKSAWYSVNHECCSAAWEVSRQLRQMQRFWHPTLSVKKSQCAKFVVMAIGKKTTGVNNDECEWLPLGSLPHIANFVSTEPAKLGARLTNVVTSCYQRKDGQATRWLWQADARRQPNKKERPEPSDEGERQKSGWWTA